MASTRDEIYFKFNLKGNFLVAFFIEAKPIEHCRSCNNEKMPQVTPIMATELPIKKSTRSRIIDIIAHQKIIILRQS